MRMPLTSIVGFAKVLEAEDPQADVECLARLMMRYGRRLRSTLNSVLQCSKLKAGAKTQIGR